MIATVIACGVVWYILNYIWGETDSALYFVFGMLVHFVGQGIPFKKSHKWQTILMQCCVLMMFIMGNAYQSLIISSMTWSRDGRRLKTFKELFESGAEMFVTYTCYQFLKNSNEFDDVLSRMKAVEAIKMENLIGSNKALIARCDGLEYMMEVDDNFNLGSHFYMLPDSMMFFYEQFALARGSPFYEKLQTMHNYVFESGIRQHWKYILEQEKSAEQSRNDFYLTNERYLLSLDDLYGVFYLLLGGYVISIFEFAIEHIWSYLRHDVDYWKITKRIRKNCRTKKQKTQIRRM